MPAHSAYLEETLAWQKACDLLLCLPQAFMCWGSVLQVLKEYICDAYGSKQKICSQDTRRVRFSGSRCQDKVWDAKCLLGILCGRKGKETGLGWGKNETVQQALQTLANVLQLWNGVAHQHSTSDGNTQACLPSPRSGSGWVASAVWLGASGSLQVIWGAVCAPRCCAASRVQVAPNSFYKGDLDAMCLDLSKMAILFSLSFSVKEWN